MLHNQKGMTLIETIVTAGLIALGVTFYIQISGVVQKSQQEVQNKHSVYKIMLSIQEDIVKDNNFIIPLTETPNASGIVAEISDSQLFGLNNANPNFQKIGFRCYDQFGEKEPIVTPIILVTDFQLLKKNETGLAGKLHCNYVVYFYKKSLLISGRPAPISQYSILVQYYVGTEATETVSSQVLKPVITDYVKL